MLVVMGGTADGSAHIAGCSLTTGSLILKYPHDVCFSYPCYSQSRRVEMNNYLMKNTGHIKVRSLREKQKTHFQ